MPEFQIGLLDILTLPVSLPLKLAAEGLSEVIDMVEREANDPEVIYRKLAELQMAYDLGELEDADYHRRSQALERRLQSMEEQERASHPVQGRVTRQHGHRR